MSLIISFIHSTVVALLRVKGVRLFRHPVHSTGQEVDAGLSLFLFLFVVGIRICPLSYHSCIHSTGQEVDAGLSLFLFLFYCQNWNLSLFLFLFIVRIGMCEIVQGKKWTQGCPFSYSCFIVGIGMCPFSYSCLSSELEFVPYLSCPVSQN